jgi:hypothetical protein
LPNVRHESVLLPLLVQGRWDYVNEGILDRTHLRFFTFETAIKLLADNGFAVSAPVSCMSTKTSPEMEKAAALVEALGGDPARFKTEAGVVQYLLTAAPSDSQAQAERPGDMANQWQGSRPIRVLLAAHTAESVSLWPAVLKALLSGPAADPSVSVGLTLPPHLIASPPAAIAAIAEELGPDSNADLLLIEAPDGRAAWERLVAAASMVVTAAPSPELEDVARRVGADLHDGRSLIA